MEVQNIVYIIIAAIIGGIILFIKSYIKKKGENLADQQHSKEIEKIRSDSSISSATDTKLLRLLITANDAIRKEDERYEMYGCGYAFNDLRSLSAYLVQFEARYKRDRDAKRLMDAYKEFIQLDKDKEIYRGLEEPEYYRVISEIHPCIKRLIEKYMPK